MRIHLNLSGLDPLKLSNAMAVVDKQLIREAPSEVNELRAFLQAAQQSIQEGIESKEVEDRIAALDSDSLYKALEALDKVPGLEELVKRVREELDQLVQSYTRHGEQILENNRIHLQQAKTLGEVKGRLIELEERIEYLENAQRLATPRDHQIEQLRNEVAEAMASVQGMAAKPADGPIGVIRDQVHNHTRTFHDKMTKANTRLNDLEKREKSLVMRCESLEAAHTEFIRQVDKIVGDAGFLARLAAMEKYIEDLKRKAHDYSWVGVRTDENLQGMKETVVKVLQTVNNPEAEIHATFMELLNEIKAEIEKRALTKGDDGGDDEQAG